MKAKSEKNQGQADAAADDENAAEMFLSELAALCWSVVSFDKCEAHNLTYEQAEAKLQELRARKVSGLCIITDEAAARIEGKK